MTTTYEAMLATISDRRRDRVAILAMIERVRAADADAARLDWLLRHHSGVWAEAGGHAFHKIEWSELSGEQDTRAAIDEAMKEDLP